MAEIVQLLVSPVHRFQGRPGDVPPASEETVDTVVVRAHLGVRGDRYYNRSAHRDASVTIMAAESLDAWGSPGLVAVRRTVLVRGVDVDSGCGRVLSLDSGDGPVAFALRRPAHPCRWLDITVGSGAWRTLRGHAGVRCEPLTDGVLHVGPVEAEWADERSPAPPTPRHTLRGPGR